MIFSNHSTDTITALRSFSYGLLADNFCWNNWYMIKVEVKGEKRPMAGGHAAAVLRTILTDYDGLTILSDHQNCLAIFNGGHDFKKDEFLGELLPILKQGNDGNQVRLISVADEPHEVLTILSGLLDHQAEAVVAEMSALPDFSTEIERYEDFLRMWDSTSGGGVLRQKPVILVIDDDALTRGIISHALKSRYQLLSAESAAEAVRKHILFAPNIIFLDIDLPQHDGFELLRHFRTLDTRSQIVMFSSNSFMANRLKAFAAGATGFIAKPFCKVNFEHYIEQWEQSRSRYYHGEGL